MVGMNTIRDGDWRDDSIWSEGYAPGPEDDVFIMHRVRIDPRSAYTVHNLAIQGGGLIAESEPVGIDTTESNYTFTVTHGFVYFRFANDNMPFRLDGATLKIPTGIYSMLYDADNDLYPPTADVTTSDGVIIEDPGYFSQTTTLQDIRPEGCGEAYARKIGNNVRFLTLSIRIPHTKLWALRSLYAMASGPYQVVAITDSCVIKGFIETVAPDPSSVGKEYISVKITIAEGPHDGSTA